jgi:hypothetical protein
MQSREGNKNKILQAANLDHELNAIKLTPYQVSQIPIRKIAWFRSVGEYHDILVYNINSPRSAYHISSPTEKEWNIMIPLQKKGCRFIKRSDLSFKHLHPICDKCVQKNDCAYRDSHVFGRAGGRDSEDFECFEGVEGENKIDIDLLDELPLYRLQ